MANAVFLQQWHDVAWSFLSLASFILMRTEGQVQRTLSPDIDAQTIRGYPQRQYYGFQLNERAYQISTPDSRSPQQFVPVTEEDPQALDKEARFFSDVQPSSTPKQQFISQPAGKQLFTPQQLQQDPVFLQQQQFLASYYAQLAAQQQQEQELQQPTAVKQLPQKQQLQQQQQVDPLYNSPGAALLGVRFSAAPAVAKTQFRGHGFSFSYR